jgi:hypothetical protein
MSDNYMSDAEEDDDILEAIQVWREAKPSKKSTKQLLVLLYAKDDVYASLPGSLMCIILCRAVQTGFCPSDRYVRSIGAVHDSSGIKASGTIHD